MQSHTFRLSLVAVVLLLAGPVLALDVDLTVRETAGVARTNAPVTTGVPIAQGQLRDLSTLRLLDAAGRPLPLQTRRTVAWPDGSARVVLVDTQVTVPAGGQVNLKLTDQAAKPVVQKPKKKNDPVVDIDLGGFGIKVDKSGKTTIGTQDDDDDEDVKQEPIANPQPAGGAIRVDQSDKSITLDTGAMVVTLDRRNFNLFQSLTVGGKPLLTGPAVVRLGVDGNQSATTADRPADLVAIEEFGNLRTVIIARGKWGNLHSGLLSYTARITAYAGKPFVKVALWLQNDGRYGFVGKDEYFVFDSLSIELPLAGAKTVHFDSVTAPGQFELTQSNATGQGKPSAFGYEAKVNGQVKASGQQTAGRLTVTGGPRPLNAAVRWFWQQYPKGLRFDDGKLSIDLLPAWGRWPREQTPGSRANESAVPLNRNDRYVLPGATRKRHEIVLDFDNRSRDASAAELDAPLMAMPSAAYAADTGAFGMFAPGDYHPPHGAAAEAVKRWNTWAANCAGDDPKPMGIVGTRQNCRYGPFYGWVDFGDLFWQPGTSSLHYDWGYVMALDYVRTGERTFLDRAAEMAQHRIDVDQVWSDREAHYFRGLVRYEKGFANIHGGVKDGHYKPIPSHNWIRGVAWWYYLTGDESAREAALYNAMGLKLRQVDDYQKNPRSGGQARSSGWAIGCLCDVYDLTADRTYLDQALSLWNNHLKLLWKENGPNLGMRGGNSLQFFYLANALVLLHQRTGDKELGQYIREAADWAADDANWQGMSYHDDMASNLTNYYGYLAVVENNPQRLVRGRELFIRAMKQDNNLKLYGGSGAYTKEVGKKLRNGHIWLWAEREMSKK